MALKSRKYRVLFAASEAAPFIRTGGLGDVIGALPEACVQAGVSASVILPRYGRISEQALIAERVVASIEVPMPHGAVECSISLVPGSVNAYLVRCDDLFAREDGIYGYEDDLYRFAVFSRAVCECFVQLEGFAFDIVHCNDWQTALIPVYMKSLYAHKRACKQVKTVFTVHNAMFQGKGSESELYDVLGLANYPAAAAAVATDCGSLNVLRGALALADWTTTVSPSYVRELQRPEYGEGLDCAFRRRNASFCGILNGIDMRVWNPSADEFACAAYSSADRAGKVLCKAALQAELGLDVRADAPLIIMVTRLTDQKGMNLVIEALDRILANDVQLAVLGTGEACYEEALRDRAAAHSGRMAAVLRFDNGLSHRMYAGADLLLMPSLFEPCGLSQMYAMRYGTLPVVRETGGLRDSVIPYNKYTGEGNGFSFANARSDELADILLGACALYRDNKQAWNQLVTQAMESDFSWTKAAFDYVAVYEAVCK